ncbi:MAG TPA: lysylphosphatidylglycerol synthase transmembrane domain-containing protein [Polyangiaceae bacterium]|jgi:uncharacterized membrane protein YbhN (UPF0104 family)
MSKTGPSSWRKRAFAWGLATIALAFVVYAVPLRDRCLDPQAPSPSGEAAPPAATLVGPVGPVGPKFPLSRGPEGCTLHRGAGKEDLKLSSEACAHLRCEPGLASTLAGVHLGKLALLLALYFAGSFAWAVRWRALLALARVHLGAFETWRVILESQAGGILLPGGIGGDALRVGFVVGKGANLATVVAAVLLDRVLGLVTVAGLAAAFAATSGEGALGPLVGVLGAIPFAFVAGLALLRWPAFARLPLFQRGPLARVVGPVLDYLGDPRAPRAILIGLGFSVLVSALQLGVIRGLVAALGAAPNPERWVYVGTTMAFIIGAIPALPGGWGTSDAAFMLFLGRAGLAASISLAVSLLYRLFWYSSGGVGAIVYLLRHHASPSATHAGEAGHAGSGPAAGVGAGPDTGLDTGLDNGSNEERAERNA